VENEKWLIQPGEQRVIDLAGVRGLKVGLVRGRVDIVGHDGDEVRVEVHRVERKDLRITLEGGLLHIDHPQMHWGNFLEGIKRLSFEQVRAEISIAVPRSTPLTLGVVDAEVLVAELAATTRLSTVSGPLVVDGLLGDLDTNTVSGEVQVQGLVGSFDVNSVSGDVTVSGSLRRVSAKTVSGDIIVDATGPVDRIATNTVSGNATLRIDDGRPANLVLRTTSGAVQVDGVIISSRRPYTHTARIGELAGSFVDVTTNSVSGDVTIVRRPLEGPQAGAPQQPGEAGA